jgi:3-phosphoshikimate 1-carboxyvinyltransferase
VFPTPLAGRVTVPGDKSISHRALLLNALAPGASVVSNVNLGSDVAATCRFLSALGATCEVDATNHEVQVYGCGWGGLKEPEDVLDAGNSGTTLRVGLGLLAGAPLGSVVSGDASLRRRPMLRVVNPLRRLGAVIDGRRNGDLAPLWIRGGGLVGADLAIEVASAQVKSALLIAGLAAAGTTSVTEPAPSRDHTERMLAAAGARLDRADRTVTVSGGHELEVLDRRIPGDLSSAMFLIVAGALIPGSDLEVAGVGLNPTRAGGLEVLEAMGADLEVRCAEDWGGEPVGSVRVRAAELTGIEIAPEIVPSLIDEIPVLAVAATQARGTTEIRGAAELRVKESDRIEALATGLGVLGADVRPTRDGLVIHGSTKLCPGRVDARGDHRMALSFAVAGLVSGCEVNVQGWESVEVSFPGWEEVVAAARGGHP